MADDPESPLDDLSEDLDELKLMGGLGLMGAGKAMKDADRHRKLQRRAAIEQGLVLGKIKKEIKALRETEEAKKRLPQCPVCGGRMEGQFRKCMHCQSDLSWVAGVPCEPGKEKEALRALRQQRAEDEKRREEQERQRELERQRESSRKRQQQVLKQSTRESNRAIARQGRWAGHLIFGGATIVTGGYVGWFFWETSQAEWVGAQFDSHQIPVCLSLIACPIAAFMWLMSAITPD